jgi:hypothetical protein
MSDETVNESPEERLERARAVAVDLRRRRMERGAADLPERRPQPKRVLDAIDMVAYTSKITYNGRGDVVWTVVIPHQYREQANDLPDTFSTPLHVTIQKWSPLDAVRTAE